MSNEEKDREKLYQDQLYGTKVLTPLAIEIIDTPEFQRLSGIKQLCFADLVYRGAQHTRFCHSVGTYFLTRTIMRRIAQNHERLGLEHPGKGLHYCFSLYPPDAFPEGANKETILLSNQSKWRGLMEVVSIAALLHDIGHVPFGHTLEDEFVGIYERHDRLAGPRLYELLFNEQSSLKRVFGNASPKWIENRYKKDIGIKNEELAQLIYVILSWKEEIDPPRDFDSILKKKLEDIDEQKKKCLEDLQAKKKRLEDLKFWYTKFNKEGKFHPFMSDIIGNTICADLLDYLPRDRMNLGMEYRNHSRLQRYLTICEGKLYDREGKRVSIMVTRHGRGGQRRDVATAVLDIMRERYEMSERVYYHHKKAAASSMLAKLAELCIEKKPKDDENIYPAPWTQDGVEPVCPSTMLHFSDTTFIDYLGKSEVTDQKLRNLQKNLYLGLRFRRDLLYRTLLVVDTGLVQKSTRSISYFAKNLREDASGNPSNSGRLKLEKILSEAAHVKYGEVLVYCPSPDMQAKEVDARVEIIKGRVLPLRVQSESFTYHADIKVLEQYYHQLWKIYIFVSPRVYKDHQACKAIVDKFCDLYEIPTISAYEKVRGHNFKEHYSIYDEKMESAIKSIKSDNGRGFPSDNTPSYIGADEKSKNAKDDK